VIAPPILLVLLAGIWAVITFAFRRTRHWLLFYLTGAFGLVMLVISFLRSFGIDAQIEAVEVQQVIWMAHAIRIGVGNLGATGLAIPNHAGWAVFDVGIECSGLLELLAFVGLVVFYPGFTAIRKIGTLTIGIIATWIINLLRILLIVGIISVAGTGWVFAAHAVFGRLFFFAATVTLYWYLVTRPTVTIVGQQLEPAEAADEQ
jgi:exosortase family protein XrtG